MSILRRYAPKTLPLTAALVLAAGPALGQEADEPDAEETAAEEETDDDSADEAEEADAEDAEAEEAEEAEELDAEAEAEADVEAEVGTEADAETEAEGEADAEEAPVGPITTDDAERDVDLVEEDSEEDRLETDGEVIELTGTHIRRQELTTSAPLTVMDRSDIESTGEQSIGDVLQQLPSQVGGINTQFNNGGTGATRVDMRGLGASRTLVLVNGRRHVPSGVGANASVDLNSIPMAIIERVDVLKDGASAIYGSDAIGGVVNIITRDDFEGTEATLYTGTPQNGSLAQYDASVVTGTNSDRGNVMFSAGYHETGDMFTFERDYAEVDRSFNWAACDPDDSNECTDDTTFAEEGGPVTTLGSSATPQGVLLDQLGAPGNEAWQRAIDNNPSGTYYNDPEAGWRDANLGAVNYPELGFEGDAYNYQPDNYLVTPQQRYNLFSTGSYELHDRVESFYEATYVSRRSEQLLAPEPMFTFIEEISVSGDNVYNPFGRDFIDIRRRFVESGNRLFKQDVNTSRLVLGLRGDLPSAGSFDNWHWDLAYNFGRTQSTEVNEGRLVKDRLEEAIGPSYVDDAGQPRCGSPGNPGDPECVPLNLFGGAGSINQNMLDYITYTGVAEGFNQQNQIQGNLSGQVAETPWDGDVSVAVGAEYRDLAGGFQPDPITAAGNTTGNAVEPTAGDYQVMEGYTEVSALPVVGKPMAEWVEFKAAARVFDYSTFDFEFADNITWETGGRWQMDHGVSLRGTYSTAFRAPGIGALFSGSGDSFPLVSDPCSAHTGQRDADPVIDQNCQADDLGADHEDTRAQQRAEVGGNPDLTPETANILTAGAVYEPEFVDNLGFTLDYFNISVRNAISSLGSSTLLNACYGREDRGANIVPGVDACDRINRDSQTGLISVIEDPLTNLGDDGGAETAGIDLGARYNHQTPAGRFGHSIEGTWLHKYDTIRTFNVDEDDPEDDGITHGRGVYDAGVRPTWRFNLSSRWGFEEFGAGTNIRYTHSITECEANDCEDLFNDDPENNPIHRGIRPNVTADLFGSYTFDGSDYGTGTSRFSVGVNNVLDTDPPFVYNGFTANSEPAAYDFLGRYFYLRFTQTL